MFDHWADPVVHLLLLKSSVDRRTTYDLRGQKLAAINQAIYRSGIVVDSCKSIGKEIKLDGLFVEPKSARDCYLFAQQNSASVYLVSFQG